MKLNLKETKINLRTSYNTLKRSWTVECSNSLMDMS